MQCGGIFDRIRGVREGGRSKERQCQLRNVQGLLREWVRSNSESDEVGTHGCGRLEGKVIDDVQEGMQCRYVQIERKPLINRDVNSRDERRNGEDRCHDLKRPAQYCVSVSVRPQL